MARSHIDDKGMVIGIAALAAGVGAMVAMLFAPRSGKQTREDIRQRAMKMKESMKSRVPEVNDAHEDGSSLSEHVDRILSKSSDSLDKGIHRARRKLDDSDKEK